MRKRGRNVGSTGSDGRREHKQESADIEQPSHGEQAHHIARDSEGRRDLSIVSTTIVKLEAGTRMCHVNGLELRFDDKIVMH